MKKALTDMLICPRCLPEENRLQETISEAFEEEITEGTLKCSQCSSLYPIQNGIAFLNPNHSEASRTQNKYESLPALSSYLWSHYGDLIGDEQATDEGFAQSGDVALPRTESKRGRGHRGFEVRGDPALPPVEAARRRDFSVNAISLDPLAGELVDPFDGCGDLARRTLRAVDPATFGDDSLRVLRAVQFAARFEFEIDTETVALCRGVDPSDLPPEWIWGEVEKWLLGSARPAIGWWAARELGTVERLWPEIAALVGCEQEPEWHPEGDVFTHTALVLDEAAKLRAGLDRGRSATLMLAEYIVSTIITGSSIRIKMI